MKPHLEVFFINYHTSVTRSLSINSYIFNYQQVDLGRFFDIAGIITTNRDNANYRILTYKIGTSIIGSSLELYDIYHENGEERVNDIYLDFENFI